MSAATRGSVYIDDVLWEQEQDRGDRDVAGAYNAFKKPRMEKKASRATSAMRWATARTNVPRRPRRARKTTREGPP